MDKLSIWRWAHYVIVGILFTILFMVTIIPHSCFEYVICKIKLISSPIQIFLFVVLSYILGLLIWNFTMYIYPFIEKPIFVLFKTKLIKLRLPGDEHIKMVDHRDLRLAHSRKNIAEYLKTEKDKAKDNRSGPDSRIVEYKDYIFEMIKSNEGCNEYFKKKLPSEWQSCNLLLTIMGIFFYIIILFLLKNIFYMVQGCLNLEKNIPILLILLAFYLISGIALLSRNKLYSRDVAISILLDSKKVKNF